MVSVQAFRALRSPFCFELSNRTQAWLVLVAACIALLPTWAWMAQRFTDGSDDPLGLLAMLAMLAVVWAHRQSLGRVRAGWLRVGYFAVAAVGLAVHALAHAYLSGLPSALVGVVVLACAALAVLPRRVAAAPMLGMAVLALPILASLQFYAGYPLRVVTAEVSRWLLWAWFEVSRTGTSLMVDGQLIIVDAPCSGVQMVWMAYFTACAVALWRGVGSGAFVRRLPLVGCTVLLANVLRNSVLVAGQAAGSPFTGWQHSAVGLVALAAVCALVARYMLHAKQPSSTECSVYAKCACADGLGVQMVLLWAVVCVLLGGWSGLASGNFLAWNGMGGTNGNASSKMMAPEQPALWQGKRLRPMALTAVEERFAQHFPGAIQRLTTGHETLTIRTVHQPTRMLHSAADCYRGLGYRISQHGLQRMQKADGERDAEGVVWQCFTASKDGEDGRDGTQLRVCERIEDAVGNGFTDTSSWYWQAVLQQSKAPWRAVTVARVL